MIGKRHELARLQSDFYRDNYYKLLRRLTIAIVIMILLILVMIYLVVTVPSRQYYATTSTGQIIPMTPRT